MTPRHPKKTRGFSWARLPTPGGGVIYRLYWYSATGSLCFLRCPCTAADTRKDIARELRRVHHNCRVMRTVTIKEAA